jgi:transposase
MVRPDVTRLDERIKQHDQYIEQGAKEDVQSRQLMQLAGIGPTTASAIVATVGKGHDFSCGRQFCAWLGLVPGQYSSGGKQRLGRITKAGDPYLRTLLIMGGKAVVAIAAKNARVCWAMLQQGDAFRLPA